MNKKRAGGLQAAAKIRAKDPDFFRKLGQLGGKAKNPKKGFGSNRDLAREFGKLNGSSLLGREFGPRKEDTPKREYHRIKSRESRARRRAAKLA